MGQGRAAVIKVHALIQDDAGETVTVMTAEAAADGRPLVTIVHGDHVIRVSADAAIAAIRRARIDGRYEGEIDF